MKRILLIGLAVFLSVTSAVSTTAQKLGKEDFHLGTLRVDGKFELVSTVKDFGSVGKIDTIIQTHRTPSPETTYVYQFDSLKVIVVQSHIRSLEFTSGKLRTHRGIRIGDTAKKVRERYGEPSDEDFLGCPSGLFYFKRHSTLGLNFCIADGHVVKILVGWGGT
jgi:hypothetical protein